MYQIHGTKTFCESPICVIRAAYPARFILLDVVTPVTFDEKYKNPIHKLLSPTGSSLAVGPNAPSVPSLQHLP